MKANRKVVLVENQTDIENLKRPYRYPLSKLFFYPKPDNEQLLDSLSQLPYSYEEISQEWELDVYQFESIVQQPIRNHSAFLNSYAEEDEGLYDDYPTG